MIRGKTSNASSNQSHSHRGLIEQDSTPVSYLIRITIPQPKIRIKIPKLIANAMQKRSNHNEPSNNNNNTSVDCAESSKTTSSFSKPRKLLLSTTKVGSIFTNVFHNKKKQKHRQQLPPPECLDCGNIPAEAPTMACKLKRRVVLPGSKKRVEEEGKSENNICGRCNRGVGIANGVSSSVMVIGRRESSGKLVRVSSRVVQTQRKQLRKFDKKKDLEKGRDSDVELCKKRILMGGKCKPLNISGTLHYDNNGILLPDE